MRNPETPLTLAQKEKAAESTRREGWFRRLLVQEDEMDATLLGDKIPDETMSSWFGRLATHKHGVPRFIGKVMCRVLNVALSKDHDQKAEIGDETRGEEVAAVERANQL